MRYFLEIFTHCVMVTITPIFSRSALTLSHTHHNWSTCSFIFSGRKRRSQNHKKFMIMIQWWNRSFHWNHSRSKPPLKSLKMIKILLIWDVKDTIYIFFVGFIECIHLNCCARNVFSKQDKNFQFLFRRENPNFLSKKF